MSISRGIFIRSALLILLFLSNAQAKIGHEKQLDIYLNPRFEFDDISKQYRIVGTTNLPDGYEISVYIKRKESGWFDSFELHVKNGTFYSDSLIGLPHRMDKEGKMKKYNLTPLELSPGFYSLSFTGVLASLQPLTVQKVIGKDGKFLKGKTIKNAFEDCKNCDVDNSVSFQTKIKLDGEESIEADNKVGKKVLEEYVVVANEAPPFYQREHASEDEEANLCKQKNLSGICFASLKQKWYIEGCQKKYNADHNEKKLNECLDKF